MQYVSIVLYSYILETLFDPEKRARLNHDRHVTNIMHHLTIMKIALMDLRRTIFILKNKNET